MSIFLYNYVTRQWQEYRIITKEYILHTTLCKLRSISYYDIMTQFYTFEPFTSNMYIWSSGNVWWRENFIHLVNHQQFAKINHPNYVLITVNKLLVNLFIHQAFYAKIFIHLLSLNIIATKLSHYTVYYTHIYKYFNFWKTSY